MHAPASGCIAARGGQVHPYGRRGAGPPRLRCWLAAHRMRTAQTTTQNNPRKAGVVRPAQVSAHAQSGVLSDARRLNAASIRRASLATLGMPLPAPRRGPSPADASAIADGEAIGVGRAPRLPHSASVPGKLLRSASATAGDAARSGPVPVPASSLVAVPTLPMPSTSGGADVASESGATSSMGLAEGGHDDERISHKVRAGAGAVRLRLRLRTVYCPVLYGRSQCCAAVLLGRYVGRYRALHWAACIIQGTQAEVNGYLQEQ